MNITKLESTAKYLVGKSKGILAADESTSSIEKRLKSINVESTEANRQKYRDMLLTSPGNQEFLSGVILFDETFRQNGLNGQKFTDMLNSKGIMPGIKVDTGAKDLTNFPGEQITFGLDGLKERFEEYAQKGATFSKWRAVITIGDEIPSLPCIEANMHALARYAALAQDAGIVPIVEPEVVMDGSHTIQQSQEATKTSLVSLFKQLSFYKVHLPGIILKPNMINSGTTAQNQSNSQESAQLTVKTFIETVPKEVPGIVFLSGGLSPDEATMRLNLINQINQNAPWQLSYSFGRALQQEALNAWQGKDENVVKAQKVFMTRLRQVSKARDGKLNF